jgi:diketogulonate reductase-like aldo/keto reductase
MQTVTLSSGHAMPLVGFGTWQLTGRKAYDATRTALDAGYRHLDTATMYRNEAEVGRAVRDSGVPREDIFVTTKIPADHAGRERATLTASLTALGLEYLDLWLIHWPPTPATAMWDALRQARDEGLTRSIGVSNYSTAQLDALGEVPAVNQIPWSPFEHDAARLAEHTDRGIVLEGYSPFKRSNLRDPDLMGIAKAHGVSSAQVILRWHIQHGIVVIPKSATPERIRANLDLDTFTLSPTDMSRLDSLSLP